MKTRLSSLSSISLALLALLSLSGCGRQGAESGRVPVSAEKTSFREVTSRLDPGGNLYFYLSTERVLGGVSGRISGWREFFVSMPGMAAGDQERIGRIFDLVSALVNDSGIEDVSGLGMSSIATATNFYHSKLFLHHYPGRGSGFLWKLFGTRPHALDGVGLAPANTAGAMFMDLDLELAWSELRKHAEQPGLPEAKEVLDQLPARFESVTGLKWEEALKSLGGEVGLVLTLDDSNPVPIPLPGQQPLQIAEPGLMIVLKTRDDTLFNRLDGLLKQWNPKSVSVNRSDLRMRSLSLPLPLPVSLRPSVATSGGYLFVASGDTLIEDALAVRAGRTPGLRSTSEYQILAANVPAEGNQFSYISRRFGQTLRAVQRQALDLSPKMPAAQKQWLEQYLQPESAKFAYCVGANTDEGWFFVGNGNHRPATSVLAAAVVLPAGVLAGVAVPAFAKARAASQKNACINNLRQIEGAKQQWALEKNMPATAIPSKEDLEPYLAGKTFPACPGGGHYTIGAVDQSPTCSIRGHRLKP
jgi:hypothetical protein